MADFEKIFGTTGSLLSRHTDRLWQPACDIYRCSEGWVVKFDLAGVEPEEVDVVIIDHNLIVRGTRRDRTLREGVSHYQMEITYSRFERVLSLPCDLTGAAVKTEYQNGLLTVTFLTERQMAKGQGSGGEGDE